MTIRGLDSSIKWENLSADLHAALHTVIGRPHLSSTELFDTFGFFPLLGGAAGLNFLSLFDNFMFRRKRIFTHEAPRAQSVTRLVPLDIVVGVDLQWIMVAETGLWLDLLGLQSHILRSHGKFGEKDLTFLRHVFMSSVTLKHLQLYLQSREWDNKIF